MARRPNYAQERAERNRTKQARRDEKERERAAQVEARRKAAEEGVAAPDAPADGEDSSPS